MRTSIISRLARPAFAQAVAARTVQRSAPLSTLVTRPSIAAQPSLKAFQQLRFASGSALNKEDIQSRILEVLKSFEKVDPAKVAANSSFTSDLGLDSLDAVEVVMAIEEEFSIEIPDEEADAITTVGQAIDYISNTPEAH